MKEKSLIVWNRGTYSRRMLERRNSGSRDVNYQIGALISTFHRQGGALWKDDRNGRAKLVNRGAE